MTDLPRLEYKDMIALRNLRTRYTYQFYQNVTNFFIREMTEYIKDSRVWRIVIMGETRGGKSEVASTIAKLYVNIFNQCLRNNKFKDIDIGSFIRMEPLTFAIEHVMGSQSEYVYTLRQSEKDKKLKFGQVWQIDENRENVGGLGTYSETLDIANINNIVAKFMQSELWLTPVRLQQRNAPYGIFVYQKDIKNRVNWCLLYKILMGVKGTVEYNFLGWVKIPLHHDVEFRKKYNIKKNEWIAAEISGTVDKRVLERKQAAEFLSKDFQFGELTASGKTFRLSKEQQMALLERLMIDGKTLRWNELEMYRIVDEARMIVMRRQDKSRLLELDKKMEEVSTRGSNADKTVIEV